MAGSSSDVVGRAAGARPARNRACAVLAVLVGQLAAIGCSRPPATPAVTPTGELMAEQIRYQLAVYLLAPPPEDPLVTLDRAVAQSGCGFERVATLAEAATRLEVEARLESDVRGRYAPPDVASLERFGRGLSADQAAALQQARQALVLDLAVPRARVWDGLRGAGQLLAELGSRTGGLLWDEETREAFTVETWREARLGGWTETVPDVSRHVVIHAYQKGEWVRAITLGMAKLGLPDIVVERFSWSVQREVGLLVNLLAQTLAEGKRLDRPGELTLSLAAIGNADVREPQLATRLAGASDEVLLRLTEGVWEEGDPANRLVEIGFDRYPGPDLQARQQALLVALFGAVDRARRVEHSADLLAARDRARARLPALREAFNGGLAPGEFILLKAPFDRPGGGKEWMWVEVIRWPEGRVEGLLRNEPEYARSLHAGQQVEVAEADVFDVLRRFADGREEGNETGAIIERQARQGDPP